MLLQPLLGYGAASQDGLSQYSWFMRFECLYLYWNWKASCQYRLRTLLHGGVLSLGQFWVTLRSDVSSAHRMSVLLTNHEDNAK
eukprot:scaffold254146_cov55-Attheya_sp.AAC.1